MYRGIKVKLYPTVKQKQLLDRHFDAYRWCYNLCLEYKKTLWGQWKINVSGYDMAKELFQIRKETKWLSLCKAECLRESALDVESSYKKFFKGSGFPKFKSKKGKQSFTAFQSLKAKADKIYFFRNNIKYKGSERDITLLNTNKIKNITFSKDVCGDYWAPCLVELPDIERANNNSGVVGIDLGLKDLVITSDGIKYENKKYLRSQHYKLRRLQRRFSKSKKGGKNREKLRLKIAKVYRKTFRQKQHQYHNIVNDIIRDNQTIVMETLRVKNMIKNKKLSRSIADASWGMLTGILEYKCKEKGVELIKVDSFYPSSKTCSVCGNVKEKLLLSERTYNCEKCNISIDRDINAAINLKNIGLRIPEFRTVEDNGVGQSREAVSEQLIDYLTI